MKPDPAIYLLACRRLGVAPEDCVFVGDGGDRELEGAAAVGMYSPSGRYEPWRKHNSRQ